MNDQRSKVAYKDRQGKVWPLEQMSRFPTLLFFFQAIRTEDRRPVTVHVSELVPTP